MKNLLINEKLLKAELALEQASSDNIIELCRNYLQLLGSYRDELYELRNLPEINFKQQSTLGRELIEQSRKALRAALEITVRERNRTQSLLDSFTTITGYQASETFNRLKYKGFNTWEVRSGGIRSKNTDNDEFLTISEAVETAGELRRQAYVEQQITFYEK
jgi:hypothetical protein